MPVVPQYQRTVQDRPAFQQGINVNASPDDMGAAVGRGMQGLAAGVDQAADAFAQVRALEDEAAVRDARNQFIAESDFLKYDPDTGFLQKEGKAAIEAFPDYQRNASKLRQKVAQSAKLTPTQQNLFRRAVEPLEADAGRQGLIHQGGALKKYISDDLSSSIETFANQAMLNANDPALVQKYLAAGQLELRRQGELQGWGGDTLKLREGQFVSGVHRNITLRLAQDDPIAAERYMKKNAGQMTGSDQFDLRKSLEPEIKSEQSKREADAILSGGRTDQAAAIAPAPVAQAGRRLADAGPTAVRGFLIDRAPGKGAGAVDGLDEAFATNLAAMIQDAPPGIREGLQIMSGHRSHARQVELWNKSDKTGRRVARPGNSNHEERADGTAKAVDLMWNGKTLKEGNVPAEVLDWVHSNAGKYGMYFPMSWEDWHIEPVGTRGGKGGTVAPRNNRVAPRVAGPSFDDIEAGLAKIADPDVRDLARKRVYSALDAQSKADEAREKQGKAELWRYVDQGATPDQVPLEVRQAAGMTAVSSAWSYMEAASKGRAIESDETLLYEMRRLAAAKPNEFADIDLNEYRDRLSKSDIKELTGSQTTALTDERKAREEGMTLTTAFSQATTQLEALGITTTGTEGTKRQAQAARIAEFNNVLARQMQEFKVAEERNPTPVDVQTMINRMLLPIVVSERYERSFFDPLKIPGDQYGSTTREGFLFEAGSRADSETVDVAVEYADIPIDIRRGITLDLERELGRKPNASEVVTRYEDYILDRDPTPISVDPAPRAYEAMGPDYIARPLVAPFAIPFHYAGKLLGLAEPEEADAP